MPSASATGGQPATARAVAVGSADATLAASELASGSPCCLGIRRTHARAPLRSGQEDQSRPGCKQEAIENGRSVDRTFGIVVPNLLGLTSRVGGRAGLRRRSPASISTAGELSPGEVSRPPRQRRR
jgi:hypothetical protein